MNKINEIQRDRNYGIDLLRVVAMFYVVILHCLGHGGILNNVIPNSIQYNFSWLLEIFVYGAVNIFALISGYVLYTEENKKIKISNYINLWCQVVFYGILITAMFDIIMPNKVTIQDYLKNIFPVINNIWWYFTAYTGLFVFIPLINNAIRNYSKLATRKIFILLILIFSFYNLIPNIFGLSEGYSVIWIIILYILGAIIKKCNIGKQLKWYNAVIIIILMGLITYFYTMFGKEFKIFEIKVKRDLLISYTSPTILISAIMYLILFSKMKFNKTIEKIIKFAASSSFAIYIINDNPMIRNNWIINRFANLTMGSTKEIYLYVIAFSFLFVIISILIDKIRIFIFKLIHVNDLSILAEKFIEKILNNICSYDRKNLWIYDIYSEEERYSKQIEKDKV
ncbi:MAG: acyltransferase family protein [Clostridia bacterium]|nr:acyltransferase family protein [Clostridia bacterium]